jgi:hypothetical protein
MTNRIAYLQAGDGLLVPVRVLDTSDRGALIQAHPDWINTVPAVRLLYHVPDNATDHGWRFMVHR